MTRAEAEHIKQRYREEWEKEEAQAKRVRAVKAYESKPTDIARTHASNFRVTMKERFGGKSGSL